MHLSKLTDQWHHSGQINCLCRSLQLLFCLLFSFSWCLTFVRLIPQLYLFVMHLLSTATANVSYTIYCRAAVFYCFMSSFGDCDNAKTEQKQGYFKISPYLGKWGLYFKLIGNLLSFRVSQAVRLLLLSKGYQRLCRGSMSMKTPLSGEGSSCFIVHFSRYAHNCFINNTVAP